MSDPQLARTKGLEQPCRSKGGRHGHVTCLFFVRPPRGGVEILFVRGKFGCCLLCGGQGSRD
jgi:hypothetical protein